MDYLIRKDTGTRLAYELKKVSHSQAETIVFIHGLSFDRHIWDGVLDGLGDQFHNVTYDMCGHGDSDPVSQPFSWEFLCRGLHELLDHLEIERCHLVGHGFGGIIAIKCALKHPERVQTLTLVSTPLYYPEDVFNFEYESRIYLLENDYDGFVDKLVRAEINQPESSRRFLIENGVRRVDPNTYKSGIELVFGDAFSLMEDLPKIEVPTLLMSGDRNMVYPPHYMALYASVIPVSRVQIIPNASNAVFIDHPKLFNDALKDFLQAYPTLGHTPGYTFLMKKMRHVLENAYKAETTAPTLEIRAIGRFSVSWKGVPLDGKWTQRSAKELLLYLSLRKTASRERLVEAFFNEADAHKAKNYLRVMINHLKTLLEASGDQELIDSLQVSRGAVSLRCNIDSDLSLFLTSLRKGFHESRDLFDMKWEFHHLLELYQSGFLTGLHAPWIGDLRMFIENKFSNALVNLVDWFEEQGLYDDALQLLREGRGVEIYDGYCEERIREIISKK